MKLEQWEHGDATEAAVRLGINPDHILLVEEAEFEDQYRAMVLAALRRVDRAREQLIAAQNHLVDVIEHSNDHTRSAFAAFYRAGGVTASDWRAWDASSSRRRRGGRGGRAASSAWSENRDRTRTDPPPDRDQRIRYPRIML